MQISSIKGFFKNRFRQIHTLQDLRGILVFRGHVYGIEYMLRMTTISVDVYNLS
jgi:hypothetical protein